MTPLERAAAALKAAQAALEAALRERRDLVVALADKESRMKRADNALFAAQREVERAREELVEIAMREERA